MNTVSAIETTALRRTFGKVAAVDGIDLRVEQGTFFGFLGPNGAGKSTTLRMLTGVLPPTSGSARVLGLEVDSRAVEVKRRIGVVPEQLTLYDRLTGPEYLTFVGRMYGVPRAVLAARADELLGLMGLAEARRTLVVDYSHGMKKKLAFAASILHEPRVLFLDEPFEGIDAVASKLIKSILNQLLETGVTIFLTSHILEIVERLCTDIAIINHGRLVACGPLDELRQGIAAADARPGEVRTLEELFIALVGTGAASNQRLSWLA